MCMNLITGLCDIHAYLSGCHEPQQNIWTVATRIEFYTHIFTGTCTLLVCSAKGVALSLAVLSLFKQQNCSMAAIATLK